MIGFLLGLLGEDELSARILLVSPRYRPPYFRGGVERYVHVLAAELRRLSCECEIISLEEDVPCVSNLPHRFLRVPRIPFVLPLLFGLMGRKLWQGADVIAVQYTPLGALIPKERLVCTVHTTGHGEVEALRTTVGRAAWWTRLRRRVSMPLERSILRRARLVVAISEHVAEELVTIYGVAPEKIKVVGNGVDCEEFRPNGKQKGNLPLRVLYVGRLVKRKNVDVLIRATGMMRHRVSLRIVGMGTEQVPLASLADRHGLSTNVEFRGFRAGKALVEEYHWADLLAIPSSYEGVPLAALEAKATGLPIVAANFLGAEKLATAASGVLLGSSDAEDFARAFDMLAGDHAKLRSMADSARREAVERYSWREPVSRLKEIFDEIAKDSFPSVGRESP